MDALLGIADKCGCLNVDDTQKKFKYQEHALSDFLEQTMSIQDQIFQLHERYELLNEYSKTFDLVNETILNQRLLKLDELCSNLEEFCLNKDRIVTKIQAPIVDNSQKQLKIDLEYQSQFVDLLKNISRTLDIVHQSLNDVEWASVKKKSFDKSKLDDEILKTIPKIFTKCKRFVSAITLQQRNLQNNF
ncbi:hypothetical protein ABK040_015660 [Willaertia magna]